MNTEQRRQVRQNLLDQNFSRTGCTQDLNGTGEYTETWAHADGTVVTVEWGPKDLPSASVASAGCCPASPEALIDAAIEAETDEEAEALILAASEFEDQS